MSDSLRLPCPTCSGTGTDTHEDRHTETNRDTCRTCGGEGQIPARTGESAEASFQAPATTLALDAPPAGGDGGLREALVKADLQIGDGHIEAARRTLHAAMDALARPDPREQAVAGVGVEPFTVDWFRSLFAEPLWNVPHWQRDVLLAVSALTQPNQTPEAAAPSGSVGEKPAKERARELRDIILSDVRAASRPFAMPGEPVGVSAGRLSNILTARLGCHFAALATQQPAPQAPIADAAGAFPLLKSPEPPERRISRIDRQLRTDGRVDSDDLLWMASMTRAALTPPQAAWPGDGEAAR